MGGRAADRRSLARARCLDLPRRRHLQVADHGSARVGVEGDHRDLRAGLRWTLQPCDNELVPGHPMAARIDHLELADLASQRRDPAARAQARESVGSLGRQRLV